MQIVLSVKRGMNRKDDEPIDVWNKEFKDIRLEIIKRDRSVCLFCGFCTSKYQEIHHKNDDHADNRPENLMTVCKLCHACHHIALASKNKEAMLIWLPEISQIQTNCLLRALYVVNIKGDETQKKESSAIWNFFVSRNLVLQKSWGTANPIILANALARAPDESYQERENTLFPIRLLVTETSEMMRAGNGSVVSWWAEEVYLDPISSWNTIADQFFSSIDLNQTSVQPTNSTP